MASTVTDNEQQIAKWKIKNLIKQLDPIKGIGTSMITLIVPPKDQLCHVTKMLADEHSTASNIKSRQNRASVLAAIAAVQQRLKRYTKIPANGLVIYCGTISEAEGKHTKVNILLEPFKPINTSLYMCDSKFHTEPLKDLLNDEGTFGFIIIDGHGVMYCKLQGNTRTMLYKFSVMLPNKHSRGGQSAGRFARVRLAKHFNYVKKACDMAKTLFIADDIVTVNGLVIAGSADFKNKLAESGLFDSRLKSRVLAVVDVCYGGEPGFKQAIELASSVLGDIKFLQEKKLIAKFFQRVASDGDKTVCYGVTATLLALEMGVVECLIVWEDLDVVRYGLKCPCGETAVKHFTSAEKADRSNFRDQFGHEMDVVESTPVQEWLVDNYRIYGANLEIITGVSAEGHQFTEGFGGIGALLRYTVNLPKTDYQDDVEFDLSDYD